jgi:NifB/MoaA-like Fe-S oxidoreductase
MEGEFAIIPKQMLKSDEAIMLDGMSTAAVEEKLGVPIHAVDLAGLTNLLLSVDTNHSD